MAAAARDPGRCGRTAYRSRRRADRGQPAPGSKPGRPAGPDPGSAGGEPCRDPFRVGGLACAARRGPGREQPGRHAGAGDRACPSGPAAVRVRPGSGAGQCRRGTRLDRRIGLSAPHQRGWRFSRGGVRAERPDRAVRRAGGSRRYRRACIPAARGGRFPARRSAGRRIWRRGLSVAGRGGGAPAVGYRARADGRGRWHGYPPRRACSCRWMRPAAS